MQSLQRKSSAYYLSHQKRLIARITNICYKNTIVVQNNEFVFIALTLLYGRPSWKGIFHDSTLFTI